MAAVARTFSRGHARTAYDEGAGEDGTWDESIDHNSYLRIGSNHVDGTLCNVAAHETFLRNRGASICSLSPTMISARLRSNQTEIRPDAPRVLEPLRVVDGGTERQRGDWADTQHAQ